MKILSVNEERRESYVPDEILPIEGDLSDEHSKIDITSLRSATIIPKRNKRPCAAVVKGTQPIRKPTGASERARENLSGHRRLR